MYLNSKIEKECCGCKACLDICPKKCISMKENEEGFLYPKVDQSKCIKCNLCKRVCPNECAESELKKANEGYAGICKKQEVVSSSSSGGAFSAICKSAFTEGYLVYGVKWNEDYCVCHDMAKTYEDSKKFRKSKYIMSDMNHCYNQIAKQLKENNRVLFSGTPCQCAAIIRYMKCKNISTDKLLLVDIVCHGAPSQKIFDQYLDEIGKSNIKSYSFRHKSDKGKIDTRTAQLLYKDGTEDVLNIHNDAFLKGYYGRLFYRISCGSCKFARIERISDITLGDAWHIENVYPKWDSEKGVSMILINTEKGKNIFEKCKKYMDLESIEIKWAEQANQQLRKPTQMHPGRDKFFKLYKDIGVKKSVNKAMHNSLWKKIYNRIKNVISV